MMQRHSETARPPPPAPPHRHRPTDDDWYGNPLWLEARQGVLLTHSGALFSSLIPDARAAQLRPVGPWLTSIVHDHLASEQLPSDTFGPRPR